MMINGVSGGARPTSSKFLDIRIAEEITPVNAIFYEATADSKAFSKSKVV
jgi:hypothetical protein